MMVVAFWSAIREGRGGDESVFAPYLAFDSLFNDLRALLLDLALHFGSATMSSSSDVTSSQISLGGALQQLTMVVTVSAASKATLEQVSNATQSYGW